MRSGPFVVGSTWPLPICFRNFFGRRFMVVAQFWRYLLSFSLRSFLMTALAVLSVSGRISWARWVASPAATSAHSFPSSPQCAGTQTKLKRPTFSTAFHMVMPQLVSWPSGPVASLLSGERESVMILTLVPCSWPRVLTYSRAILMASISAS